MIYEFFFLTYALIWYSGKYYNINMYYIHEYLSLALSLIVYFSHDIPFIYDNKYLFSDTQPYEHINKLIICIIIYLFLDLFFNKLIKIDIILHHFGGIIAYSLAILGNNVGVVNNCVKFEISNIWLCLYKISKNSNNIIIKNIYFISVFLFLFTYIIYRIIPSTIMFIEVLRNLDILTQNIYSSIHIVLYIIHISLQYFWFIMILKKFFSIIKENFSNKIK
jgi:hypothetical protein